MAKNEIEVLERKDGRIVNARTITIDQGAASTRPGTDPRQPTRNAAKVGQGFKRTGKTARDRQKRLERVAMSRYR